jgi:hypothetical protein
MEKAEGNRDSSSADNQEQLVNRHPASQDPTKNDTERTSDNSTVENGDLSRGSEKNRTMPGDEASLRTEI